MITPDRNIKAIQELLQGHGFDIAADGKIGNQTRMALLDWRARRELPGFTGSLSFLYGYERYKGYPYWPGGASGVTLDIGVDIGHNPGLLILYAEILSPLDFARLSAVGGIRGTSANAAAEKLRDIEIDIDDALAIFPHACRSYWHDVLGRWQITRGGRPPEVDTVLLSLAYNRGGRSRKLSVLDDPIEAGDWKAVGEIVKAMQQDHHLRGIPIRREAEGQLILDALDRTDWHRAEHKLWTGVES